MADSNVLDSEEEIDFYQIKKHIELYHPRT
jgi:hypothetical protein